MKVIAHTGERELSLRLEPDELDAIPAINRIWFHSDRKMQFDACRASLLAFLLTTDLIGNVFDIQQTTVPAHLASALQRYLAGHELFVCGICNSPRAIVHQPRFSALIVPPVAVGAPVTERGDITPGSLHVRRTNLGYEYLDAGGQVQLEISTNMDLHLALHASQPEIIASAVLYLYCYDTLRPAALAWYPKARGEENGLLVSCLKEAGGNVI